MRQEAPAGGVPSVLQASPRPAPCRVKFWVTKCFLARNTTGEECVTKAACRMALAVHRMLLEEWKPPRSPPQGARHQERSGSGMAGALALREFLPGLRIQI